MADDTRNRHLRFFDEVHRLARENNLVAYVIVGVTHDGESFALGTGSGSRLETGTEVEDRLRAAMARAFERGLELLDGDESTVAHRFLN